METTQSLTNSIKVIQTQMVLVYTVPKKILVSRQDLRMIWPCGLILSYLLTAHIQYSTESKRDGDPSEDVEIFPAVLASISC